MGTDSLSIGPYTVGEKPAPLVYQFLDSAGAAMDLTGWTATFHYQRYDGTPEEASATVSDPAAGKVTYTWTGSEFSTPGVWWAEFWAGNTVNLLASKRLEAVVRAPVGTPPLI